MSRSLVCCVAVAVWMSGVSVAYADQCEWVDEAVAQKAVALIREAGAVVEWCQPCGEEKPGPPRPVTSVEMHNVDDGRSRAIAVNGKDEDLAYLYVRSGSDTWRNASKSSGCPSTGVTSEFRLSSDGAVAPLAGKVHEVVGTVVGVEEGDHARCIVKSGSERIELRIGSDFRGRCRDLLGAEVRMKYTEEALPDAEEGGDARVLHSAKIVRPESRVSGRRGTPAPDDLEDPFSK
jgi:hypothetical protein